MTTTTTTTIELLLSLYKELTDTLLQDTSFWIADSQIFALVNKLSGNDNAALLADKDPELLISDLLQSAYGWIQTLSTIDDDALQSVMASLSDKEEDKTGGDDADILRIDLTASLKNFLQLCEAVNVMGAESGSGEEFLSQSSTGSANV
jgi:hypothetical protein